MKLKCLDGECREFIPLSDFYIRKGFDPYFLEKDGGFLQLGMPPDFSIITNLPLLKLGIKPKGYFWHWSRIYKKINPISLNAEEIIKEIDWVAFHPSMKNWRDDDFMGRMDLFTILARLFLKIWNFFALNHGKSYSVEYLIPGVDRENHKYFFGHKLIGFDYSFQFKEDRMLIEGEGHKFYEVNECILGYSKHVYISLKDDSSKQG